MAFSIVLEFIAEKSHSRRQKVCNEIMKIKIWKHFNQDFKRAVFTEMKLNNCMRSMNGTVMCETSSYFY